jgi:hypothetical protein
MDAIIRLLLCASGADAQELHGPRAVREDLLSPRCRPSPFGFFASVSARSVRGAFIAPSREKRLLLFWRGEDRRARHEHRQDRRCDLEWTRVEFNTGISLTRHELRSATYASPRASDCPASVATTASRTRRRWSRCRAGRGARGRRRAVGGRRARRAPPPGPRDTAAGPPAGRCGAIDARSRRVGAAVTLTSADG